MAKDEHTSRGSNSSSGGGDSSRKSSKKLKHKKVPQRGMGVAQLEKIISEQRQKNQNQNENHQIDHTGSTTGFATNLGGFGYESDPHICNHPLNHMMQRSQHLQQPCSLAMVNVSAGSSSSLSSSVQNFQMEPPSNQSYCGNNHHLLLPEEEKTAGMKRPCPYFGENEPNPSFHSKFPSAYVSPISRSDESGPCGNGGTTSMEPARPSFRENPSSSSSISDATTMKFIEENQVLTKEFLKLAPPQASQSNSCSKEKLYLSPCIGDQEQFERLASQKDQAEDLSHLSGRGWSNLPQFLAFFPGARIPMGQPENSNCEPGESVDLNLRL